MINIKNWPVFRKVLLVGLLPVAISILVTNAGFFIGMYELKKDALRTEHLVYSLWHQSISYINELNETLIDPASHPRASLRVLDRGIRAGIAEYTAQAHDNEAYSQQFAQKIRDLASSLESLARYADSPEYDPASYQMRIDLLEDEIDQLFTGSIGMVSEELEFELLSLSLLIALSSLFSIAVAILLARYLATQIVRPIQSLRSTYRRFGTGHLNERSPVVSGDELGDLGASFNTMADKLQELIALHQTEIEERKRAQLEASNLEAELRQTYKMDAVGTLAGGIAHDFNNLLTIIMGYSDMAGTLLEKDHPAAQQIREAMVAANRARDLVQQILTFSRKEEPERAPLDLGRCIQDAIALLRATIPTTVEIRVDCPGLPGKIMANLTQVNQVAINLCVNAAQAMEDHGGVLEISLTPFESPHDTMVYGVQIPRGQYQILTVADNGPGIDPKYLGRIFDPYFTTKPTTKGSGMGLAVVAGIVQGHDGVIAVDSNPGIGTIFKVFFPQLAHSVVPSGDTVSDELPAAGSGRIMVVDDEPEITEIIQLALSRHGYQVHTFTSSAQALEVFRGKPHFFDLLITDQTMPKLTGVQLSREILAVRADFPIILCTGYSTTINAKKAEQIGIRAFAYKPVQNRELVRLVGHLLAARDSAARTSSVTA